MTQINPRISYSLLPYNTFGIAVNAACFIEYSSVAQLNDALSYHRASCPHLPILHIGGGSNLLFLSDFEGLILHSAIQGVEVVSHVGNEVLVRVGAGMSWDKWVEYSLDHGWYGLENLSLIPGEVGASAVQNIGAYGVEVAQCIHSVEAVDLTDGSTRVFLKDECDYGYRHSAFKTRFKGRYAITHVTYSLSTRFTPNLSYRGLLLALEEKGISKDALAALDIRETVIQVRQQKLPDPLVMGNAGSFFMNPVISVSHFLKLCSEYPSIPSFAIDDEHVKVPAAWLIEQCGWKGKHIGPAAVHKAQPLVLVNQGGATGADILTLCRCIQQDVLEKFDIELHPEVMMI